MKWIWIRHGETDLNGLGCYLGHLDVPLNDRGQEQIKRLIEETWCVTKVFSSDLLRCKQTAEMLVGSDPIHFTRALRELDFGEWDGKRYDELMQKEAEQMQAWYQDPFTLSPPQGETLQQLGSRVDTWLLDTRDGLLQEDVILVVSHGGPLRWVLSRWLLGDAGRFWDVPAVAHGEGFVVDWDGACWGKPQFFGGNDE